MLAIRGSYFALSLCIYGTAWNPTLHTAPSLHATYHHDGLNTVTEYPHSYKDLAHANEQWQHEHEEQTEVDQCEVREGYDQEEKAWHEGQEGLEAQDKEAERDIEVRVQEAQEGHDIENHEMHGMHESERHHVRYEEEHGEVSQDQAQLEQDMQEKELDLITKIHSMDTIEYGEEMEIEDESMASFLNPLDCCFGSVHNVLGISGMLNVQNEMREIAHKLKAMQTHCLLLHYV
jgi:hypothetical protein